MNPEVAQALQSAALLGTVIRPLLVVTILFALWHVAFRNGGRFTYARDRHRGAAAVLRRSRYLG
jgi:hypothetical protein